MPYHDPYLRTITGTLIIHKVRAGKKAFWQASAQYKEPRNDRFGCQASAIRSIKARQGIKAQQKVKKSFFGSSLIDKEQKNDFSAHRSSTKSRKTIFRLIARRQRVKKSFLDPSRINKEQKNDFSARRSSVMSRKIVFLLLVDVFSADYAMRFFVPLATTSYLCHRREKRSRNKNLIPEKRYNRLAFLIFTAEKVHTIYYTALIKCVARTIIAQYVKEMRNNYKRHAGVGLRFVRELE